MLARGVSPGEEFYIRHAATLRMKGPASAILMALEGPKIIAHGFNRGKTEGTR